MKKSERLNDMIRYLNGRAYFNLHDLMDKYNISKSTALRDIGSLEQLGMPIFAEHGRYGRYGLLKNRLLSPITFTMDEVFALYFAMLTLESYQSTPFHLSASQLNEKFESCLSKKQIAQIRTMQKVLQFETHPHHHVSRYLDQILQSILNEKVCSIRYSKNNRETSRRVQFFKISARFGQWYAAGMDCATNAYRVFRCDRITAVQEEDSEPLYSLDDLVERAAALHRSENSIDFEVEIAEQAKDIFYKEHYPSMALVVTDRTVITGFYNAGEEAFIADYFMRFGKSVRSVKPESLRRIISSGIEQLLQHYRNL